MPSEPSQGQASRHDFRSLSKNRKFGSPEEAYVGAKQEINNAGRRRAAVLDLSGFGLREVPPEIGRLHYLKELALSHNQLSEFPPALVKLDELVVLDLSQNLIQALPPDFAQISALKHLKLQANRLAALPPEFSRLKKLEIVDLSSNSFVLFPPELATPIPIRVLRLANNRITTFPNDIGWLVFLEELDINRNGFSELPVAIPRMVKLQRLDLAGNELKTLPREIHHLQELEQLDLRWNKLSTLPSAIASLKKLQSLLLSHNHLTELPREIGSLTSLVTGAKTRSKSCGLELDDNPLPYPYSNLIAKGQPSATRNVLAWLRGELDANTLSEAEISPPNIPNQSYGPHFDLDHNSIIIFARPNDIDQNGNNVARLKKLHPGLRNIASDLVKALGKGNIPHANLRDRAEAYRTLIDQEIEFIDFSLLYVEGVRLANAEKATSGDRELPPLEPAVRETVDTLLQVHGTFVLSTAEGLEAIAAEERYQRTPKQESEYRKAAVAFAQDLQAAPTIIDGKVASVILGAAEEIGRGTNLERSGVVATGTIKNVVITISTAATLAALSAGAVASGSSALMVGAGATALVVGEGLKKSKPFAAVAALFTQGLDEVSGAEAASILENLSARLRPQLRFVLRAEPQLRRLAGQREEFKWIIKSLDWINQQSLSRE
jgi:hypothetical protein